VVFNIIGWPDLNSSYTIIPSFLTLSSSFIYDVGDSLLVSFFSTDSGASCFFFSTAFEVYVDQEWSKALKNPNPSVWSKAEVAAMFRIGSG